MNNVIDYGGRTLGKSERCDRNTAIGDKKKLHRKDRKTAKLLSGPCVKEHVFYNGNMSVKIQRETLNGRHFERYL